MALGVNALDTLADMKVYISVAADDTTRDAIIEALIDGVSVEFNDYCRREFIARDRTDYYDGPGNCDLFLHNWPVVSVSNLYVDSLRAYGADTEIAAADYILAKDRGLITLDDTSFGDSRQEVKIVFNAGYAIADVPLDLRLAIRDQVKVQWRRWLDNQEGISSISSERATVSYESKEVFLPSVQKTLDRYRRVGHTGGSTT